MRLLKFNEEARTCVIGVLEVAMELQVFGEKHNTIEMEAFKAHLTNQHREPQFLLFDPQFTGGNACFPGLAFLVQIVAGCCNCQRALSWAPYSDVAQDDDGVVAEAQEITSICE